MEAALSTLKSIASSDPEVSLEEAKQWDRHRDVFDCSDEVIVIKKDRIRENGVLRFVRRVFVKEAGAAEYSNVGWVIDGDVDCCMLCAEYFSFFNGRHHCRICGDVACSKCSSEELLISEFLSFGPVRACNQCYFGQEQASIHSSFPEPTKVQEPQHAPAFNQSNKRTKITTTANKKPQSQAERQAAEEEARLEAERQAADSFVSFVPGYVVKSKVADGKVFVNVCFSDSVALSAVILADDSPQAIPDKEGNLSDTYDVCINPASKSDEFNREIVIHISKEFGVDLDTNVSLPKIKGNFKGKHSPVFKASAAKVIPMTQEESVEEVFRTLANKKGSGGGESNGDRTVDESTLQDTTPSRTFDDGKTILSGYLEKEGRGMITTWNRRFFVLTTKDITYYTDDTRAIYKGSFEISGSCVVEAKAASAKRRHMFQLQNKTDMKDKPTMLMNAPDVSTFKEWFTTLNELIDYLSSKGKGEDPNAQGIKKKMQTSRVEATDNLNKSVSATPGYVLKSKIGDGKVFVNVCLSETVPVSAVIIATNSPEAVPDKEGNLSDTYDVCINASSKSEEFNRKIITHIAETFHVNLDLDFSSPKIKGGFKGTHSPHFEAQKQSVLS